MRLHTNRDQRDDGSRQVIDGARPAPSLTGKSGSQWKFENGGGGNDDWTYDRPATSIVGTFSPHIVTPPGHRSWAADGDSRQDNGVRITMEEALVLQDFPRDYPVQGTQSARFLQVGNAIPPGLARVVLAVLLSDRAR